MCGIIAAYAQRNVTPILLEGLRRMEYRGYDSAGIAVLDKDYNIHRTRALGKVAMLAEKLEKASMDSGIGIAHTRWACLLYTSPSPRDGLLSRMPSSA